MNAFPWLRLYNETLSDRKIARICRDAGQPKALVIGVWATLLMLASESPVRGELLISEDLPLSPDEIRDETGLDADAFDAIIGGLSSYALIDASGPVWAICNWDKRQPPSDNSAERVRQHRQRQRDVTPPPSSNGGVPLQKRNGNALDKEVDKEGEGEEEIEGEKNARARANRQQVAALASPPPRIVTHYIPDLTPEPLDAEYGYHPPDEPTPQPKGPPSPEIVAIGEMANAITDVTGVSAKLNREAMFEFASSLVTAGYTPEQVRTHYTRDASPGRWNWYTHDWRGRDKGDMPRLKELRETIAGATATNSPTQQKKMGAIEKALAMFGNAPNPATAS